LEKVKNSNQNALIIWKIIKGNVLIELLFKSQLKSTHAFNNSHFRIHPTKNMPRSLQKFAVFFHFIRFIANLKWTNLKLV